MPAFMSTQPGGGDSCRCTNTIAEVFFLQKSTGLHDFIVLDLGDFIYAEKLVECGLIRFPFDQGDRFVRPDQDGTGDERTSGVYVQSQSEREVQGAAADSVVFVLCRVA